MANESDLKLVPPPPAPPAKPIWLSRTVWVGAIGLLGKWIPGPVGDFFRANESLLADLAIAAAVALRLDTDRGVSWNITRRF